MYVFLVLLYFLLYHMAVWSGIPPPLMVCLSLNIQHVGQKKLISLV